jgi:glycosyltransferase involved in cell wall biosynthesis
MKLSNLELTLQTIENYLEIWIPTYNRAEKLKWILEDLANSSLRHCLIKISDNASGDDTEVVCKSFMNRLPNLVYRKQIYNVGANANILEGLRQIEHPYFWIVCDDDRLNFEGFERQFLNFVADDVGAMLLVGDPHMKEPSDRLMNIFGGEVVSITQITKVCTDLVSTMSFLPSVIYRKSLVDSSMIYWGYGNCAFMYPHMPLIAKVVNEDLQVGVFQHVVVKAGFDVPAFSTPKRFWLAWCHSCRFVKDRHIRNISKWSVFGGRSLGVWARVVRNLILWDMVCPNESLQTYAPLWALPNSIIYGYVTGSIIFAPFRLVPRRVIIWGLKQIYSKERLKFLEKINDFAS